MPLYTLHVYSFDNNNSTVISIELFVIKCNDIIIFYWLFYAVLWTTKPQQLPCYITYIALSSLG